jgi:hypothetical protein
MFAGAHLQHHASFGAEGESEVVQVRALGGADLDEAAAGMSRRFQLPRYVLKLRSAISGDTKNARGSILGVA